MGARLSGSPPAVFRVGGGSTPSLAGRGTDEDLPRPARGQAWTPEAGSGYDRNPMDDTPERGLPSSVRGWLSEVYLPALVSGGVEQLLRRLGERATVDDPIFGRAKGKAALTTELELAADWLRKRKARFETTAFTTGSDRDVTEGRLALDIETGSTTLPVAIVAERRPGREVEIRLYYATHTLVRERIPREPLVPRDDDLAVPPPVAAHLAAIVRGDIEAIMASFENGATLRDPLGTPYQKEGDGGTLRTYYERLLAAHRIDLIKGARADDGSTCALEFSMGIAGEAGTAKPGLAVYVRGESGLLRGLRVYHEVQ